MDRLSDYIQRHLTDYIQKELEHGYSLESVKRVLLNYHHHNIVDAALKQLEKDGFRIPKKERRGRVKKLDKRLFLETVNLLQDYIIRQKKRGYESHHIKEALLNFGHSDETVTAAINAVEYGTDPLFVEPFDYEKVRRILFPVSLVAFVIFVIWLSASVNENLVKVAALFFPAFFTLFLVRGFFFSMKFKQAVLGFPVGLVVLFYLLGSAGQFLFRGVELVNLSVLNFIFAFMYTSFYIGAKPEAAESEKEDLRETIEAEEEDVLEEEFGRKELSDKDIDKLIEKKIEEEDGGRLRPVRLEVKEIQ